MSGNIIVSICCLVKISLLVVVYFSKKRIMTFENNIYASIIITNFFNVIVEIFSYVLLKFNISYTSLSYSIFMKFILFLYLTWIALFFLYVMAVSYNVTDSKNKKIKIGFYIYLILSFLVFIFPMSYTVKKSLYIPAGIPTSIVYAVSAVVDLVIIFVLIKNHKNILDKKYIPVAVLFVIGIFVLVFQSLNPEYFLLTPLLVLTTFVMYFTIENPDVKMIQQLEIAKDTADKANAAKTDFLSNMSHEIRTPLNAIVGFSDEIEQSSTLEDAKENAKDIISASNTLLEIVNSILDISKIEAGKLEIINSDYNPKELFTDLGKLITPKMNEKALDFQVSIAEDLPKTLYGDKANIKKVVTNLLSNAYKYTDKGFVKYTVSCVKKDNNCRLIISVEDSGRGMKPENVDKLFTKFQRIDEDRNTTIEGTGLGLALTKQLLELMGGNIIVHTVYGEGSKFTATLDQRIDNIDIKEEVSVPDTIDLSNKRILVVDDNPLNLKVATKLLQRYNALVECCDSGFSCIDKVSW